jgi:hypothetical protein
MIGRSGSPCLVNMLLSSTRLRTHHYLFRPALYQSCHLPRHCICQWHCLRLPHPIRHRHLTRPIRFTVASTTTLLAHMGLLRRLRHYHLCLSATLAFRNRRREAVTITQPSHPPSVLQVFCRTTRRRVILHRSATTQGLHCLAFLFRKAHHKTEVSPCRYRRLITSLPLMYLPEQWVWCSRQQRDNHNPTLA